MGTSSKALALKLQKLAKRQHGCFTAAQAVAIGYADSVHLYHVNTGHWLRVFRGVYRLAAHPFTPRSRCMAALLWTRGKSGDMQGALAPETARALRQNALQEHDPVRILVDKKFRRSSQIPPGILILHSPSQNHQPSNSIPPAPPRPSPGPPRFLDAPDYYDWLDYQNASCHTKP